MKFLRRFIKQAFDKGGVLIVGISCLLLCKHQYFPHILGPLSYGLISVGFIGFARYIIMDYDSTAENEDYQKLLDMLNQRKSEIEANRDKLEELRSACESFMAMRETLEGWRRDPSLVQDKVTILEELLKKRDCGTSMLASKAGSTQGTVSDIPIEQWSSCPSQKDMDTGVEDVGETRTKDTEYEPREDTFEKNLEEAFHKIRNEVLHDLLEEVTEEVLEEESEKVLEDISGDVQKEMCKRMQAEFPENAEWEISDKRMEQIMEKVQKELFEGLQESADEMSEETFEILQKDMIEDEVMMLEHAPETEELEISQTRKETKEIASDCQHDISGKRKEKLQLEKESKDLPQEKSRCLEDSECQEMLQARQGNVDETFKEPKEHGSVPIGSQEPEHSGMDKIEMEIAEALLEPDFESNR